MNEGNTSGSIRLDDGIIVHDLPGDGWSLSLCDIRLIGEYTNSDGPFFDDYFLVFLSAVEGDWHQASFYADGCDSFLEVLSGALGTRIETGLCTSADFRTRILWPPDVIDKPFMEIVPKPTRRGRLWARITGVQDTDLSETAKAALRDGRAESMESDLASLARYQAPHRGQKGHLR